MATFKQFEDIEVWQKARLFRKDILVISESTALKNDYKLKDQILNSSRSIIDNIAEGVGRGGNAEFIQHVEISNGSACESQSQLYQILDSRYINTEKFLELYNKAEEIKRMLLSLIRYLQLTNLKGPKYKARELCKRNMR